MKVQQFDENHGEDWTTQLIARKPVLALAGCFFSKIFFRTFPPLPVI
jgi:hypothetical protein